MSSEERSKFKQTAIGLIPKDWEVKTVGDIFTLSQGLQIAKNLRSSVQTEGSVPLLKITELPFGKFAEFVNNIQPQHLASRDDIIYTRTGQVGLVYTNFEGCVHNNCFKIHYDPNKFDKMFVFYFLKQKRVYDYANSVAGGSVQKDLSHPAFKSCIIAFPSLSEQKMIGKILKDTDSKIELNQEMNKNLEAIGQAIFKRWFVDFEFPNEDGKPYKSSGGKMVFSDELEKEIPIGWEMRKLKEVCHTILRGFTTRYVKKSNLVNLNQKVNRGDYLDKTNFKFYQENTEVPEEKFARRKDILVNSLGQGTLGRVHLFWERKSNIVVDQHITIVRTKQEILHAEFLYFYLRHGENQDRLESYVTGSTGMLMLNISKIREFLVLVPNKQVQDRFAEIVSGLYDLKLKNAEENESLFEIRGVLLPRLMSGKIRVPFRKEIGETQ